MAETPTRELNGAVQNVRRAALQSVTLLRQATGRNGRDASSPSAANDAELMRGAPSIVSANTEVGGPIATTDEMHVYGKVMGNISAAAITVCAGAVVKGDLTAETIVIDGTVEGRIEAQHVVLRGGANVTGEIVHGTLGIDTAATFEGAIKKRAAQPAAAIAAE